MTYSRCVCMLMAVGASLCSCSFSSGTGEDSVADFWTDSVAIQRQLLLDAQCWDTDSSSYVSACRVGLTEGYQRYLCAWPEGKYFQEALDSLVHLEIIGSGPVDETRAFASVRDTVERPDSSVLHIENRTGEMLLIALEGENCILTDVYLGETRLTIPKGTYRALIYSRDGYPVTSGIFSSDGKSYKVQAREIHTPF